VLATHPWRLTTHAKRQGQWLILVWEEDSGAAAVGLGNYPDGRYSVLGKAVIVVSRQQACALLERLVVRLLVLVIHIAPVALDMAIEGLLDEPGEVGVLARQVVYTSTGDNLPGIESRIDYK